MLSRVADSIYWMSRYVERAEHIARILLVNSNTLMDIGELAPDMQEKQWRAVMTIMRAGDLPEAPDPSTSVLPVGSNAVSMTNCEGPSRALVKSTSQLEPLRSR